MWGQDVARSDERCNGGNLRGGATCRSLPANRAGDDQTGGLRLDPLPAGVNAERAPPTKAGGMALGGAKMNLVLYDTGDTAEKAKNAAQRLVAQERPRRPAGSSAV
jgi:hypothetical protein